jgi:hypothetical protein
LRLKDVAAAPGSEPLSLNTTEQVVHEEVVKKQSIEVPAAIA